MKRQYFQFPALAQGSAIAALSLAFLGCGSGLKGVDAVQDRTAAEGAVEVLADAGTSHSHGHATPPQASGAASPGSMDPAAGGHGSGGHGSGGHGSGGHGSGGHGALEIPEGQPIPRLQLRVEPDARRGWNLEVRVENFEFAPERVNQASVTTEGHAHLSINGEKITRLYGPWYYLPTLPVGEHELKVQLSAHGHESLTVNGQPIAATVKVVVSAP